MGQIKNKTKNSVLNQVWQIFPGDVPAREGGWFYKIKIATVDHRIVATIQNLSWEECQKMADQIIEQHNKSLHENTSSL